MRIGIFGDGGDPQCAAVAREAAALGADCLYVDSRALDEGRPLSMLDGRTFYLGEPVDDVWGFYLRGVPSPYVPAMKKDDTLVLYEDWFTTFTQTRERAAYFVAWLLQLAHRGATLVNGLQIDLSLSGLSGIPGAAGYRIKRSTTPGGPYVIYGDVNTGYHDTTKFSDVETELDTTYYYVVSAYNQLGESANSAEVSCSTLTTNSQLMAHLKMSGNVADSDLTLEDIRAAVKAAQAQGN